MMTLVVVYLYTVVAFNFFRKFYVQEGEDGNEPDRKCHNMLTVSQFRFAKLGNKKHLFGLKKDRWGILSIMMVVVVVVMKMPMMMVPRATMVMKLWSIIAI